MHEATRKGKRNRWSREAAGLRRGSGDRPKPPWKSSAREESCYLGKPRVAAGVLLLFSSFLCPVPGLGCARTPAVATRTSGTLWDTRTTAGGARHKAEPSEGTRGDCSPWHCQPFPCPQRDAQGWAPPRHVPASPAGLERGGCATQEPWGHLLWQLQAVSGSPEPHAMDTGVLVVTSPCPCATWW